MNLEMMNLEMTGQAMTPGVTRTIDRGYLRNHAKSIPKLKPERSSVKLIRLAPSRPTSRISEMEVVATKAIRRSTRVRVEIPISVTSLDRRRPFAEKCVAVIVSAQGCGFRSSQAIQPETPILLGDLPRGGTTSGRVASCLPLGSDGKYFLIGVALYNHGNFWGIANPPADWGIAPQNSASPSDQSANVADNSARRPAVSKQAWPYNLFSSSAENHPGKK